MRKPIIIVAGALLAFSACDRGGSNHVDILPVHADVTVDLPTAMPDQQIFLQKSALDTSIADDLVVVDVMLRSSTPVTFYDIDMELLFDPGLVEVSRLEWSMTPLGDCTDTVAACPLYCTTNVSSSGTTPPGDLILGIPTESCSPGATITGTVRLFSIWFIAASAGSSQLTLVDGPGSGDCEILDANRNPR